MAKLILQDANKAALFSFAPTCKTTEQAQAELTARGWHYADALKHIDAAIAAGAYSKAAEVARAEAAQTETEN